VLHLDNLSMGTFCFCSLFKVFYYLSFFHWCGALKLFQHIKNYALTLLVIVFLIGCVAAPRYTKKSIIIPPAPREVKIIPVPKVIVPPPQQDVSPQFHVPSPPLQPDTVTEEAATEKPSFTQNGLATFYANKFQGKRTAYGERYDKNKFTAAHMTLPHNTMVKVTNVENGKSVIVRINDRGPHGANRVIDVSGIAANELDIVRKGIGKVRVEVFDKSD
jgi:rare lipoprotein A